MLKGVYRPIVPRQPKGSRLPSRAVQGTADTPGCPELVMRMKRNRPLVRPPRGDQQDQPHHACHRDATCLASPGRPGTRANSSSGHVAGWLFYLSLNRSEQEWEIRPRDRFMANAKFTTLSSERLIRAISSFVSSAIVQAHEQRLGRMVQPPAPL